MKSIHMAVAIGLLIGSSQPVMADSMSAAQFTPKVLPVLVQVDTSGEVTQVSPAFELPPRFDRLLRQALDEMIGMPATNHGSPIASQFVMNLALKASPRTDGQYDAQFSYVSASTIPPGEWYWVHIGGHRLALKSDFNLPSDRHAHMYRASHDSHNQQYRFQQSVQRTSHGSHSRHAARSDQAGQGK